MTSQPKAKGAAAVAMGIFLDPAIPERLPGVTVRPKYLKREFAPVNRAGRQADGHSQEEHAKRLGTHQSHVAGHEDATDRRAPSVLQVAAGPRHWATRVIRWQAAHHDLQVLPRLEVVHGDNHLLRSAVVNTTVGALPRQLSLCLADGITDAGLEDVMVAAQSAAECSLEVAQWAGDALRHRRRGRK